MSKERQTKPQTPALAGGSHHAKIATYVKTWMSRGYPEDIPDEVPDALMALGLAPSYKAICFALLKNDVSLQSLGFAPRRSEYYDALKRIEIANR